MKKINIIATLLIILLLPIANGQEINDDPGVTPDSFLWGLDRALDQLSLLLAFDEGEKAKKGLEVARERLLEVKVMVGENKLEAAAKAKDEHGKTLVKVKQSVDKIEDDNSSREIEGIIKIEKELEDHDDEIEQTFEELKIRIKAVGAVTEEQQALIDSILSSMQGQTGEVRIEIKNRKDETKIKIKQDTGKSDEEIEVEIEGLEKEQGIEDKIEIEAEIENGRARVKVEISGSKMEFELNMTDIGAIMGEISSRTGLSPEEISAVIKVEAEEEAKEEKEDDDKEGEEKDGEEGKGEKDDDKGDDKEEDESKDDNKENESGNSGKG